MSFNYLDNSSQTKLRNRPKWLRQIITEIPLWAFASSLKWVSKRLYLREILNNPHNIEGWYGITRRE